ncbi:MAG: hypothetical protein IT285_12080 [Bdellovibrionales bacterium]|nr:hypothetical protein [Bdellovibrionales bacterium]
MKTRSLKQWTALGVVFGFVLHFAVAQGSGQVRTILISRDAFPVAMDGELVRDQGVDRPLIRAAGKWVPMDVHRLSSFPDFRVDAGQAVVSAGSVILENDEARSNAGPVSIAAPTALEWRALFAIPASSGNGFEVVSSDDFDEPAGVDPLIIAAKRYRYLGSHLGAEKLARRGDRYFYAFGSHQSDIQWVHAPDGLTADAEIGRVSPKALSLQVHAKLYSQNRLLTDTSGQWFYAVRGAHPDAPGMPLGNQTNTFELPAEGALPYKLRVTATSGVLPVSGPSAGLTVLGHREDPALFTN